MASQQKFTEPVAANNMMVFIFFLHLLGVLAASAVPEGNFFIWLPINLILLAIIFICLFIFWKRYSQHAPKRYNSLQVYMMLIGFSVFMIIPFIRLTYGTFAFWPVLAVAVLLLLSSHLWRERIASVFVNPKKIKQQVMWPAALAVIVIVALVIMTVLRFTPAHPNDGLSVFLFLLGVYAPFLATPFTLSEERIEKLKEG